MNPYSAIYDEVVRSLKNASNFRSYVKENNIVAFNSRKNPIRGSVQAGNLPEVVLACNGTVEGNLKATSSGTHIVRQYELIVSTGSMRYTKVAEPIEFLLLCLLANWPETLGTLQWNDKSYVKRVELVSTTNGISDANLKRGVNGWHTVTQFNVHLHFQTSDLVGAQ